MRGRLVAGIALVVSLAAAGTALATFQPNLLYKPPVIEMRDIDSHNSVEDVTVRRVGSDFTFHNEVSPVMLDPASDPGCETQAKVVACPRAGIEKIVVKLGNLNDMGDIDLGKSANKVKQIIKGQDGEDGLAGAAGVQKLVGGNQNDALFGGPGPDILIGGSGEDVCDGGSGHDEFIGCEAVPTR